MVGKLIRISCVLGVEAVEVNWFIDSIHNVIRKCGERYFTFPSARISHLGERGVNGV